MPAKIRSLHEVERDSQTGAITGRMLVYPDTIVSAVHMLDGRRTLDDAIDELRDGSCITTFPDNTIRKVMINSGMIITTTFSNNVITNTCTYADSTPYYVETITFSNDGQITQIRTYADNT